MNPSHHIALILTLVAACGPEPRDGVNERNEGNVPDVPGAGDACKVQVDESGIGLCDDTAPPGSFEPEIQWQWTGPDGESFSFVIPLVANLTDDNADGEIDLCDSPEVVVVAASVRNAERAPGHIYLLDGQTGAQEMTFPTTVDASVTPALGDLDHDGIPEIVTVDVQGRIYVLSNTGAIKFGPAGVWEGDHFSGALALADMDHDGEVEIIGGNTVFDHHGLVKWTADAEKAPWSASTVADLDGDGFAELVLGASAFHHDGTLYWNTNLGGGYPQVANLDADPEPEVLLTNRNGLAVIEHDGTIKYQGLRPTGEIPRFTTWIRPATIHDFDGDGIAEFAMSSANSYTLYRADGTIKWNAAVLDVSGIAAGTAFDFLGDGSAEAMYADERSLYVFGPTGQPLLSTPRTSITLSEYPVVADIDNDGSAEVVVVSNAYPGLTPSPTVQVIRDRMDRWIQARRIWNQHTYHVTNVREDGTIPQFEQPSWQRLNTFRTNAQINGSGVCQPPAL